jgi:hypothetical protein
LKWGERYNASKYQQNDGPYYREYNVGEVLPVLLGSEELIVAADLYDLSVGLSHPI